MELYINIFRIIVALLVVWHLFKRQWKPVGSLAAVLVLSYLPMLLNRWFGVRLDSLGNCLYLATLIMAMYLGNSLKLYDRFAWWDRLVHFISGIMFVNFGIAFANKLEGLPVFAAVAFAFCFSLAVHSIWELLEYAADCLFHADNQRWQAKNPDINHQPAGAMQPAGLVDTMHDLLMGLIGAVGSAVIWWVIL